MRILRTLYGVDAIFGGLEVWRHQRGRDSRSRKPGILCPLFRQGGGFSPYTGNLRCTEENGPQIPTGGTLPANLWGRGQRNRAGPGGWASSPRMSSTARFFSGSLIANHRTLLNANPNHRGFVSR